MSEKFSEGMINPKQTNKKPSSHMARYSDIVSLDYINRQKSGLYIESLFLSASQSEQPFQLEFSGYTILIFHFNQEHGLFTQ